MRVFQEGNETAQIDLTDSLTSGINRARQTLGTLIVCIIQVDGFITMWAIRPTKSKECNHGAGTAGNRHSSGFNYDAQKQDIPRYSWSTFHLPSFLTSR
jgi:hypothetical protein